MLQLVPSQRAALSRLQDCIAVGETWMALVGPDDSGKTTTIMRWMLDLESPHRVVSAERLSTPLELIDALCHAVQIPLDRTDDVGWKSRLKQMTPSRPESGPMLVVDQAQTLSPEMLSILYALATGGFGPTWSILLVGPMALLGSIARACPETVSPSSVSLPPWDREDLLRACPEAARLPEELLVERMASAGSAITALIAAGRADEPEAPGPAPVRPAKPFWRRRGIVLLFMSLLGLVILVWLQSSPRPPAELQRVPIPLNSGQ